MPRRDDHPATRRLPSALRRPFEGHRHFARSGVPETRFLSLLTVASCLPFGLNTARRNRISSDTQRLKELGRRPCQDALRHRSRPLRNRGHRGSWPSTKSSIRRTRGLQLTGRDGPYPDHRGRPRQSPTIHGAKLRAVRGARVRLEQLSSRLRRRSQTRTFRSSDAVATQRPSLE